jgi:hypothetical protein
MRRPIRLFAKGHEPAFAEGRRRRASAHPSSHPSFALRPRDTWRTAATNAVARGLYSITLSALKRRSPAATPKEVVAKLSTELQSAINTPAVRARLLELGLEPSPSDPATMANLLRQETAYWPKLIRAKNITLD